MLGSPLEWLLVLAPFVFLTCNPWRSIDGRLSSLARSFAYCKHVHLRAYESFQFPRPYETLSRNLNDPAMQSVGRKTRVLLIACDLIERERWRWWWRWGRLDRMILVPRGERVVHDAAWHAGTWPCCDLLLCCVSYSSDLLWYPIDWKIKCQKLG